MKFELGIKAKDIVTRFEGIITGRVQYLTGCNQYLLNPTVGKEGKSVDPGWYDENRIEVLDDKPLELDMSGAPGPCEPAPTN